MATDLTIDVKDFATALPILTKVLMTNGTDLPAGCGFVNEGGGVVHLLVPDADAARRVLEANGVAAHEESSLLVITARLGDKIIVDVSDAERLATDFYRVRVPPDGAVRIATQLGSGSGKESPNGCAEPLARLFPGWFSSKRPT